MTKLATFILIFFMSGLSQGYNNVQIRYAGLVDDIKYVGTKNSTYLFIIYTDNNQVYTISSNCVPYFELRDSVMEYWIEYKLTGVGKKDRLSFYSIVK
jgi:hypothetical protein